MSEDRQSADLFDFSELRRKNEDYNTTSSKNSNGSQMIELDLDSNEQIMKSFKDLRDKLKTANRENQSLREEMSGLQVQVKQLHESESNLMAINHQLKEKNQQMQLSSDQLKKRIIHYKEQLSKLEALKGEMEFLKQNFIEAKTKSETLEEEKRKIIEISIQDKMSLEEKLERLVLKKQNDDKYLSEVQTYLCKAKQTNLKLENQLKKLEIKYDEEVFNKKWSKENFQKEHYEKKVGQLQNELSQLKSKHRKQKEKRADLEKRLLQLQELTGLCNVKAEAYEGEVELMTKKVKKMQRRMSQAKQSANKMASEKINYEEKFCKSVQICQELINRVKRELMGDVVELAKTSQFRLNKLKENSKEYDKIDLTKTVQRLSNHASKQKSDKKERKSLQKQNLSAIKQEYSFKHIDFNPSTGKVLIESDFNKEKVELSKSKNFETCGKHSDTTSERTESKESQLKNIELKIRKERQEMEKKLKQKMLYRKIELSNSPNKGKLRQEYLKLIFQK